MIRVMFPDMHSRLPFSFGKALTGYGELLLPDKSFKDKIVYGGKWDQSEIDKVIGLDNVKSLSHQEFLDNPPDIIIMSCFEVQTDILKLYSKIDQKKTKLLHYSGNVTTPFDWSKATHLITTDTKFHIEVASKGINSIIYYPYIDYDRLVYSGHSDLLMFGTYIYFYGNRYPDVFLEYQKFTDNALNSIPEIPQIDFKIFSQSSYGDSINGMIQSMGTIHHKHSEGYGFAIIESLAVGRPVLLYRPYTKDRAFMNWCIENENCLIYDNIDDFAEKIKILVKNPDLRYYLQDQSAKIIREKINNSEQSDKLKRMIESIAR